MKIKGLTVSKIVFCILLLSTTVATAQIPSTRQRNGLNGPVSRVQYVTREFTWENDRWQTSRTYRHEHRYDQSGRCLTEIWDPGPGWDDMGLALPLATGKPSSTQEFMQPNSKTVWRFDHKGRLWRYEKYAISETGPSLSNWQQFTYNNQGWVQVFTFWANWGWSPDQTEPYPPKRLRLQHDQAGHIIGWVYLDDPDHYCTMTYDRNGRPLKREETFSEEGVFIKSWQGYDRYNNWTVCTETKVQRTNDEDDPESRTEYRRSISYDTQ